MGLKKQSKIADAIGNLYRAAFFLARGQGEEKLAFSLIKQSVQKLSGKPKYDSISKNLNSLLKKFPYPFKNKTDQMTLAEKVLDQYLVLKWIPLNKKPTLLL